MDDEMNNFIRTGDNSGADNAGRRTSKKNRRGFAVIIILLLVISAIIALLFVGRNKDVDMTEGNVLLQKDYEPSSRADFYTYEGNIFYSTKDSMRLVDSKGDEQWVDSYTMISPILLGDKDIAAVAEKNGTAIRVYNEAGLIYKVSFNEPVVTFAVNGMGYLGVINKKDSDYELSVYNAKGERAFGGNYAAHQGIPTAMDISDDGRMFAVSFMNISNISLESNVLFYYINSEDKKGVESSDGMFTSFVCEESMPFMLKFTADNRCIALMDNKAVFLNPTAAKDEDKRVDVPVGNQISYACVNGDGTVALGFGEPLLNSQESVEKNTVLWYDSKGNKVNEYKAEDNVTGLYPGSDVTVVAMDRSFSAFKTKGGSLWQYTAIQDTSKVLPYDGSDKILVVTSVRAMLAKVGRGNNLIEVQTDADGNIPKSTAVSESTTEVSSAKQAESTTKAVSAKQAESTTKTESTTKAEQTTATVATETTTTN